MTTNRDLIDHLKSTGLLESKCIENALIKVDRRDFVRKEDVSLAYYDDALPIGFGQTISQPLTVVFMLELLDVKRGNKVMDIGSGSGWQSCLLGHLVGPKGIVHALELIPELCKLGESNTSKYPDIRGVVKFHCKDARDGLPDVTEGTEGFDRIICAAEVKSVPQVWRDQLKSDGVLIYPKDEGIYKEVKGKDGIFSKEYYPGFVFVPFV
jgi:protein-L-isoaspartate(D-aspartate) O-methyltransferase